MRRTPATQNPAPPSHGALRKLITPHSSLITLALLGFLLLPQAAPAAEADEGFVPLFNGKDLDGWQAVGGGGSVCGRKEDQGLASLRLGSKGGDYRVEDGLLILEGGGGTLRTEFEYEDYDLHVEWRAAKAGYDSGLYFHGGPQRAYQVQMAQGAEGSVGGLEGAGGQKDKINPPGQWNSFDLICRGRNVTLSVNGKKAWDAVANRSRGYIGIQAEGHRIDFRNLRIKEHGVKRLFDGKDLTGWKVKGNEKAWTVEHGEIVNTKAGGSEMLYTNDEYTDFRVRLEWRVEPGGNSGLFVRYQKGPSPDETEIQILDDYAPVFNDPKHPMYYKLKDCQHAGSVYCNVPPRKNVLRKAGEWNQMEVTCKGRDITVWMDGEMIVESSFDATEQLKKRPTRGAIGLQDHGGGLWFRNVSIKPL